MSDAFSLLSVKGLETIFMESNIKWDAVVIAASVLKIRSQDTNRVLEEIHSILRN